MEYTQNLLSDFHLGRHKIIHLKNVFRKAENSNKSGRNQISCPFYEDVDKVLGDRPSFCPDEGDMLNFPSATNVNISHL